MTEMVFKWHITPGIAAVREFIAVSAWCWCLLKKVNLIVTTKASLCTGSVANTLAV